MSINTPFLSFNPMCVLAHLFCCTFGDLAMHVALLFWTWPLGGSFGWTHVANSFAWRWKARGQADFVAKMTSKLCELLQLQSAQLGALRGQRIAPREDYLNLRPPLVEVEHQPVPHIYDRGLPEECTAGIVHDATAVVVESEDDEMEAAIGANDQVPARRSAVMQHLTAIDSLLTERSLKRRSSMGFSKRAAAASPDALETGAAAAPSGLVTREEGYLSADRQPGRWRVGTAVL